MPFLIRVPRSLLEEVRMSDLGELVILDIDSNELRTPFKGLESLPRNLVSSLKEILDNDNVLGDVVARKPMRPFLSKKLKSQIFQQIVDERLELLNPGRSIHDEFEEECNIYSDAEDIAQNLVGVTEKF
ncbi:unnamed protein product [Leptosia nina]|uniref:Uncharacterized protein n=1 Tax=Leptosia nina TaxID=320188 RepID=A0AAV1JYC6_9NEOP